MKHAYCGTVAGWPLLHLARRHPASEIRSEIRGYTLGVGHFSPEGNGCIVGYLWDRAVPTAAAECGLPLIYGLNVLVPTARQDERLIAIERRVDRLEQSPGHR